MGDVEIGPRANIGAGTITANYDGTNKHPSKIGADARIGSNSVLVAPVEVGEGAYTGAGSVVTNDVAPNTLVKGVPAQPDDSWAERRKDQAKRASAEDDD
jgi:bifunctional UDP-N-acetylglucosamine pyrophosphorylase/glucosamine-1-phosphate N-acetyltransferase